MAEALGASDIIVLTEPSISNDSFQIVDTKRSYRDDLLKQMEIRGDIFDIIINTNNDCVQDKDLNKFVIPNGLIYSTLPPELVSDSCGFVTKLFLKWYIFARCFLQVSDLIRDLLVENWMNLILTVL